MSFDKTDAEAAAAAMLNVALIFLPEELKTRI